MAEKDQNLEQLIKIAKTQNSKINLSIILITLKPSPEDIPEIINQLEEQGIEVINEDVEVDESADEMPENAEGVKIIPFDPSKIDIKMAQITIDSIIKRIKNNELELNSSFQRKAGLWTVEKKSRLIESIFLKIPLPAFYFDASNDENWLVIDGLQRVSTIKEFVVDEKPFKLKGLEFLKDFNGLTYDKLPRALQRRLEETNLNACLVQASTPKNVKFNIFKRLNTGGLVLESQEIRNALYQGQACVFLQEMADIEVFKEATCNSINSDRMLDKEFCLRFVTLTQLDLELHNKTYEDFLNEGMEFLSKAPKEKLLDIKNDFIRVMNICITLFGNTAFRRINNSRRGPVNKALFESWSFILNKMSNDDVAILNRNKDLLKQAYCPLFENHVFLNSIRASDKTSIKTRLQLIEDKVSAIINEGRNANSN